MRDERLNYPLSLSFSYDCFFPFSTTHDRRCFLGTNFALMSSGKLDVGKANIICTTARLIKPRHEQQKEHGTR
jgi:hypothetical protein